MEARYVREVLRELPEKAVVIYRGPSEYLRKQTLQKVHARSAHMVVTDGKKQYKVKYFNLSCDSIELARSVAEKINGIEEDLPF